MLLGKGEHFQRRVPRAVSGPREVTVDPHLLLSLLFPVHPEGLALPCGISHRPKATEPIHHGLEPLKAFLLLGEWITGMRSRSTRDPSVKVKVPS